MVKKNKAGQIMVECRFPELEMFTSINKLLVEVLSDERLDKAIIHEYRERLKLLVGDDNATEETE